MPTPLDPAIMSHPITSHGNTVLPPIGGLMNSTFHPPSSTLSAFPAPPRLGTMLPTTSNADDFQRQQQQLQPTQPTQQAPGYNVDPLPRGPKSLLLSEMVDEAGQQKMGEAAPLVDAMKAKGKPPLPPLDSMRAYRACINCRSRKSKCDLEINQGRPPCRRCQREDRECILGESHRGGRRVRKKPKLDDNKEAEPSQTPAQQNVQASSDTSSQYSPRIDQSPAPQQSFQPKYEGQQDTGGPAYPWMHPSSASGTTSETMSNHRLSDQSNLAASQNKTSFHQRKSSNLSNSKSGERQGLHDKIASADLQNPSDALEILAQVADRAEEGDSSGDQNQGQPQNLVKRARRGSDRQDSNPTNMDGQFYYKPVQDGLISPENIAHLFSTYQEFFHPFFPIAPQESFDQSRLPWMSRYEPHLFSAILTVASKDDERIHHVCYDHMQHLVSMILAGADADIEAVEALLLLSQWVSHRPQASVAVGRGEEDRVAWMYIGTALRLGYFLGIDRSSFEPDSREDPKVFNRKRLTWLACYMCDRQVSVRVGKGFWSRGPGPMTGLKGSDFPSLSSQSPEGDNWALQLQANLELIQIFSNVHDILYSSKGHGWKEMLEGRYAKYLDDFRTSIRNWNDVWGTFTCSSKLKASMLLTYDYLRLYVNAFAYQATISRALTTQRDNQHNLNRPTPLINATAPDARFIYEALDAAKSLLSTFNNFVEPETLRYMPSSYYLFIIYSAVFLYKARSTTTMTDEERTGVRRMINQTIERLQKASMGANHMGSRYARLLQLLWRKAPKPNRSSLAKNANMAQSRVTPSISERLNPRLVQQQSPLPVTNASPISSYHQPPLPNYEQAQFQPITMPHPQAHLGLSPQNHQPYPPSQGPINQNPNNTFSWLDLGATWNFATQNNSVSVSGSGGEMDMDDEHGMWDNGMSPFDMGLLTDYSVLEGDNPNLIF